MLFALLMFLVITKSRKQQKNGVYILVGGCGWWGGRRLEHWMPFVFSLMCLMSLPRIPFYSIWKLKKGILGRVDHPLSPAIGQLYRAGVGGASSPVQPALPLAQSTCSSLQLLGWHLWIVLTILFFSL
jgi:hypothetical protein